MATKTKAGVRTGSGKGARRPPVKVKRGAELPLLPIVVGAILVLFAVGIIIYSIANNKAAGPQAAAGVPCDSLEHTQIHYHAALQITYLGNQVHLPANLGIVQNSTGAVSCYYWLHVHAANPDTIHIESPATQTFTLGQFFSVWNSWSQVNGGPSESLSSTHVSTLTLTPDQKLVVYVKEEGKDPQLYTGDPNKIVLKAHEVVTLEITPPAVTPPPSFTFASGL
jgi:hypothetical protein